MTKQEIKKLKKKIKQNFPKSLANFLCNLI